jgi:hypothetical protein
MTTRLQKGRDGQRGRGKGSGEAHHATPSAVSFSLVDPGPNGNPRVIARPRIPACRKSLACQTGVSIDASGATGQLPRTTGFWVVHIAN